MSTIPKTEVNYSDKKFFYDQVKCLSKTKASVEACDLYTLLSETYKLTHKECDMNKQYTNFLSAISDLHSEGHLSLIADIADKELKIVF